MKTAMRRMHLVFCLTVPTLHSGVLKKLVQPVMYGLQANNYLATVTLKEGKVYAFFVKSPTKVGISEMSLGLWCDAHCAGQLRHE